MQVLVINGSLGGSCGNTARLIARLPFKNVWHLAEQGQPTKDDLAKADAFVFCSGTYWDSWGSPLQSFLEKATPLEGDPCWFGKPAAVLVTMHSVGGKGVLSRLQGVLNTLGLYVPPMSAIAYSFANQAARENESDLADDLWSVEDLDVLAKNLETAAGLKAQWQTWPFDRSDPHQIWLDVSK